MSMGGGVQKEGYKRQMTAVGRMVSFHGFDSNTISIWNLFLKAVMKNHCSFPSILTSVILFFVWSLFYVFLYFILFLNAFVVEFPLYSEANVTPVACRGEMTFQLQRTWDSLIKNLPIPDTSNSILRQYVWQAINWKNRQLRNSHIKRYSNWMNHPQQCRWNGV